MIQDDRLRLAVFDLDGTLYRGDEAIPHAVEAVTELRSKGVLVRYLTNNSGQTRAFYRDKLNRMGFPASEDEVYSSGTGTASHLLAKGLRSVFVVGMQGLVETLREAGIDVVNAGDGPVLPKADRQATAVVVGICRTLSYELLDGAMQQILGGAEFVATNTDATFPLENGRVSPGAGSIVAAVSTCSGHSPFVVGKPNPFLVELVMKDAGVPASQTLAVGDRMDTDIESGLKAGAHTHLVLTGVDTKAPEGQTFSPDLRGVLSLFR